MNHHAQSTRKRPRNHADTSLRTTTVVVDKPWPGGETEQQGGPGPGLNVAALQALSRKGLWGLLLFLLASVAAFRVQDFNLYQTFPEAVLQILGCPPPAILIHLALTGYSFTVVVPVLIRMATGENPLVGWHHLPCRAVFFLFYLASTTLPENFLAVVIIGTLLYAVEQVGVWSYRQRQRHDAEASG